MVHSAAAVGSKLRRFMGIRPRRFNSSVLERGHDLLASSGVLLPAVRVHSALRATRDCVSGEGSSACANARISTYHRCVPTRPLLLIVRPVCDSSGQPVDWSEPVSPSMASFAWLRLCKIDQFLRQYERTMIEVLHWKVGKLYGRRHKRLEPTPIP